MIKSFRHKGLRVLFETGKSTGVQPQHARRLQIQLSVLDSASSIDDVNRPASNSIR